MNETLDTKTIAIVIGFIALVAIVGGAVIHMRSHASIQASVEVRPAHASPQSNAQFVQSVVNLPPSQRMDYIKQHPMEFNIATETPGPDMPKLLQAMEEIIAAVEVIVTRLGFPLPPGQPTSVRRRPGKLINSLLSTLHAIA